MKDLLKYGIIALLAALAIVLVLRVDRCSHELLDGVTGRGSSVGMGNKYSENIPSDTSFKPVEHATYQPPSLPFLSSRHGPARLPAGAGEKDVKQVVSLKWKGVKRTTDVIQLRTGETYVEKDSLLEGVTVTDYERPLLAWEPAVGVGVSVLPRIQGAWQFSPSVSISALQWVGRVNIPVLCGDFDGIGFGVEATLYHDFSAGGAVLWRYAEPSQKIVKATLHYNL